METTYGMYEISAILKLKARKKFSGSTIFLSYFCIKTTFVKLSLESRSTDQSSTLAGLIRSEKTSFVAIEVKLSKISHLYKYQLLRQKWRFKFHIELELGISKRNRLGM